MIYFQELKNSFLEIFAFFETSPKLFLLLLIFLILIFFMGFLFAFLIVKTSVHSDRKKDRKDAINRSRAVLSGQMLEQVAPFLPDFPCNPADVRFVGKPIDFVAFPGAVDNKPISEILFIEVKSGNSVLSEREKEIKSLKLSSWLKILNKKGTQTSSFFFAIDRLAILCYFKNKEGYMEEKYIEMHIDDMKSAKNGWQSWQSTAKRLLRKIQNTEETKSNRWELKSLEMSYTFFIKKIGEIISIYSKLINLAENCDLEEDYFLKTIKSVQRINKELKQEYNKKSFIELNNKHVHGIKEAEVITSI